MTYKNLVVALDTSKSCGKRVEIALALAQRFDAHLVGLFVGQETIVPSYVMAQLPLDVAKQQQQAREALADRVIGAFERAAQRAGRSSVESRRVFTISEDVSGAIGLHGRYADLLILGQHDPDDPNSPSAGQVEHSVLTVGRPCLVVPYIGAPADFGKRVVLAWDAGREAARAASDALAFLQAADKVNIVAINPATTGRDMGHGQEPGADIALALARHGVKAEAHHVVAQDIDPADTLLSRIADLDADLLVMGAYGHSRWRELVLGGVTRAILEHMTVPVLMSH